MDNLYQAVGSFYRDGNCNFAVWAPLKKSMQLVISDPGQKVYDMQKDETGYWKFTLENRQPGLRYSYQIDGDLTRPDPASVSQPGGVHEASEVIDRNFQWTDNEWKGTSPDDLVIYELHTGTFTSKQTFEGVIDKLGYLEDIGINAIEIMPVAQFPGSRNWGYDGVYPFAVHNTYGGANGLKRLVNAVHQKGIAVILDVVYNHIGPEGGYLSDFAPYFTPKYKTPWGDALNFDDEYSDGVRNYFFQNAIMWLDEYHIDGLRMDAVHAIMDNGATHYMRLLKDGVKELETKLCRKKFLIAELDLNNPRYINPHEKGGYGLDGQWNDEFHHALHAVLTGETDGYYTDFGALYHLEKAFRNTYVYNGIYSPHRKKIFGAGAEENAYSKFVVFSQNHDHVGNRMLGDRLTTLLSFEQLKLAAAVVLLSPYIPLLFMGEEWGETAPFLYFTSHGNADVIKKVTEGRKKEFAHFVFSGEFPDPQAEETFQKSMLTWKIQEGNNAALLSFYKQLIHFRKTRKALLGKERSSMKVYPVNDENILAVERKHEDDSVLIVFNFNKEPKQYELPIQSSFCSIFNSASRVWNGSDTDKTITIQSHESITISPMSALIFEPYNNQ